MDITVYLPDDLARRAKSAGINLSRTLRDAIQAQFAEEDAIEATLQGAEDITLDLEDGTIGRFTGTLIGSGHDVEIYLSEAGNVVAYDAGKQRFNVVDNPEEDLANWLPHDPEEYVNAMRALGLTAVVDLDI